MTAAGVPAEQIGSLWPSIEPLVAKGLAYSDGLHGADAVCADLIAGRKQLVMSEEPLCILITEILNYADGRKACNVFLTAGAFPHDWQAILSGLEDWAKEKGCDCIEMTTTRKGWFRRLPAWKPVRVHLRKEI